MPWFGGIARSCPAPRPHQYILRTAYQWLETKRKRKLEAHEVFSEDPALYRWQCWASTCKDPNSKDPTFVEDPRFRAFDNKVGFNCNPGPFSQGLFICFIGKPSSRTIIGSCPNISPNFCLRKNIKTTAAGRHGRGRAFRSRLREASSSRWQNVLCVKCSSRVVATHWF